MNKYIDVVFDGPPSRQSGRFVEVEDHTGKSINAGDWLQRDDGLWALRIWEKHYHRAHYEDGKLTRACAKCGEDLMHGSHERVLP